VAEAAKEAIKAAISVRTVFRMLASVAGLELLTRQPVSTRVKSRSRVAGAGALKAAANSGADGQYLG
jgi:hypothetical protein